MTNKEDPRWIKVSETDSFIVEYNPLGKYRVSYFEDGHYVDECIFPVYGQRRETSKWIVYTDWFGAVGHVRHVCPKCGVGHNGNPNTASVWKDKFCTNCGTEMLGSVEVTFAKFKKKLADGELEELVE